MKKQLYKMPELTLVRVEVRKVIAASGSFGESITDNPNEYNEENFE